MAEYIDRNAFIQRYRELYCTDCDRRKGMKKGKLTTIYEIGGPPCRACRMDDVLCDLEDYPTADVAPVRHSIIVDRRKVEVDGEWRCARCGWPYTVCVCGKDVTKKIHFCPYCGATLNAEEGE